LKGITAIQNETELPKSAQYSFVFFYIQVVNYNFFFKCDSIQKTFLAIRLSATGVFTQLLGKDAT